MGVKTSKNGDHKGLINFLCNHYAKRMHRYLKGHGETEAKKWKQEYLNMYSGLAAYEILRENGYTAEEGIQAYDYICLLMRKIAALAHKIMDLFPSGYEKVVKSLTDDLDGAKSVCWTTEVVEHSSDKFEYKIHTCLYYDVCKEHGYPEFTAVFCNHDHWAFGVLHRHVRFERYGAIGDGDSCCHDVFYRVKKGEN